SINRQNIAALGPLHDLRFQRTTPTQTRAAMAKDERGLTYAQAGVDIDAGNRMVDLIKPLVRATARPGADAEIGGFGGLFDLKRCGFTDPVLVAAPDSRSRSRPADTRRSGSISSPCPSTISLCKAPSRCSSSTIMPAASSRRRPARPWWQASPRAANRRAAR